jgi:hypothetical protein
MAVAAGRIAVVVVVVAVVAVVVVVMPGVVVVVVVVPGVVVVVVEALQFMRDVSRGWRTQGAPAAPVVPTPCGCRGPQVCAPHWSGDRDQQKKKKKNAKTS